nr:glycosyltransferase family A protein [Oceanipulchritudo coccoides]
MRTQSRPMLLERAIQSVCDQSFKDWELVIVRENNSPDTVDQVLESLSPENRSKVRHIHLQEAVTEGAALNAGRMLLESRFVLVHDDGNSLHPEFLERTTGYLKAPAHPSVKGVVTGTEQVFERVEEASIETTSRAPFNDWLQHISMRRLLAENVIASIAFLYDREACEKAGGFDESLPVLYDWEFYVRFLTLYEIAVLPEVLAFMHQRGEPSDAHEHAQRRLFFDNLLRNRWLRSDIQNGRTGPGVIANEARMLRNLTQKFKKRSLRLFKKA